MLQINDVAPVDIEVLNSEGEITTLANILAGGQKMLVVYFYPKDDTPGCTAEACGIRDIWQEIQATGADVAGISKDKPSSHVKFAQKYKLPFRLLADPDHKLIEAFGAWGERKFMGKTYMGTIRSTFILDTSGKVVAVWPDVKPDQHANEILAFLKNKKS